MQIDLVSAVDFYARIDIAFKFELTARRFLVEIEFESSAGLHSRNGE
jgi:hypothetical protein